MKYHINNLCIEVTRKCNMNCAHCLRGEAQNMNISTCHIDKLLENVKSVGNITFTGGEPSLNIQAIEYTLRRCKDLSIDVFSFYVVTNGKANTLPLAISCLKWYAYCSSAGEDMCGIALSRDMFHDEIDIDNEGILRGLSFFREDKFTDFDRVKIINSGRAEELGGFDKMDVYSHDEAFSYWGYEDHGYTIESMVYLSANGEIRTNCDSSYDDDSFTVGNLNNESLHDILQRQMNEEIDRLAC